MKIEWNDDGMKKLSKEVERQFKAAVDEFNRSGSQSASALQKHMKKNGFDMTLAEAKKLLK